MIEEGDWVSWSLKDTMMSKDARDIGVVESISEEGKMTILYGLYGDRMVLDVDDSRVRVEKKGKSLGKTERMRFP